MIIQALRLRASSSSTHYYIRYLLSSSSKLRPYDVSHYRYFSSIGTKKDDNDQEEVSSSLKRPNNVDHHHHHILFSPLITTTRYTTVPLLSSSSSSQKQQQRHLSLTSHLPEFLQNITIWGGTGIVLKTLHFNGTIPYWAVMCVTSITLRIALFPLVLESGHASANFAKVAPEVQFLLTVFRNDQMKLNKRGANRLEKRQHAREGFATLRNIYKAYKINPLAAFKSPLIQIPCFWYFAIDIRKIINGLDPQLAHDLSEGGVLWFTDLTDPDPWYALPIMSGLLLYLNVELALGKQSLSGETASKANIAVYMKDFFQSLSILIPCFMATSTAGVQIYLVSSFTFTLFQSAALRNETFRSLVGLPSLHTQYDAKIATEFQDLVEKQQAAIKARGNKPVLGTGVLAPGWVTSFEGSKRQSTIKVDPNAPKPEQSMEAIKRPPSLMVSEENQQQRETIPNIPFEVMDAANRGAALPRPIIMAPVDETKEEEPKIDVKKLSKKKKKKKKKGGKK